MTEAIYDWVTHLWTALSENYHPVWDSLDILAVAFLVYWVLILIRGTRAAQMMLGLLILVFAWLLSAQLQLATLGFILDRYLSGLFLIVIVIFQNDIRRALMRVGRGFLAASTRQEAFAIEEIVRACQALAQRRVGALVVVERDVSLEEYLELGTGLDAELTRELLVALFLPYSPLHDGAVVIRQSRVAAAGCILPISRAAALNVTLGTRHRAALGVSEETDALAIVVSEETGKISLVSGGDIQEDLDAAHLRQSLLHLTGHVREAAREPEESDDSTQERRELSAHTPAQTGDA